MKKEGNSNSNNMEDAARNEMMQNLFGEQSEDEEEDSGDEPEIDSEHERAANHSDYPSEEGEGEAENDGAKQLEAENEAELEGEGENEGVDEVEILSESEPEHEAHEEPNAEHVESEGERESEGDRESERERESEGEREEEEEEEGEREVSERKMESEEREEAESEDEGYGQRGVTSKRRDVVESGSEESEGNYYSRNRYHEADQENEEEDADLDRKPRPSEDKKDQKVVRDVFGDSDEDEPSPYKAPQNEIHHESPRSPMEEEGSYDKEMRPEDVVPDEDAHYGSEDENIEQKPKEKPVGPPLELDVPLVPPPGRPDRMNVIKVSNIMGIESKPFDPKTYVEEDVFVTDETGAKKRIRLEDNIVRWRSVKNRNGTVSYESNARFVKWKDGSLQLLIGNEVLDISVNESTHDQAHLFLRQGKGVLQSQGRLLRKMRFMPSSLSSKSHRLLTALVDSRHKKVYKVKNCITEIDPEREKEERERAEGLQIRAHAQLQRKKQKVNMKYSHMPRRKERELTPGWLEDGDEEEDQDYYDSRRGSSHNRFEDEFEAEARGQRRPMSSKKLGLSKSGARKPLMSASRPPKRRLEDEYEEESEYETEGEDLDGSPPPRERREDDFLDDEEEYQDSEEEEAEEEAPGAASDEEEEYQEKPKKKKDKGTSGGGGGGGQKRKEIPSDDEEEESPPKKAAPAHRRKAVVFDSDED
ncbi:hypothetical protein LUZ63_001364 [Rhynchospora breviuscula]|uniref:RNA polymerase-associated protein LEO1 n=1 Tax=Rhynchospora breviuscula TaxID=2022672 RepID=A0A9Q0CX92_9POAL|nr:hypothetical protein LUZ63_001364 [Rhynchospora breviuscula]